MLGNLIPMLGNLIPMLGNLIPMLGNLIPMLGNLIPMLGNLIPMLGNLIPMLGNLIPMLGNLIPMLGNFHLVKAAEHCIGKYLKGSGIEDATGTFGIKVVESVLGGTHYVRSLRGLLIISEALTIMQWEAFWQSRDRSHYADILCCLNDFLGALQEKDPSTSKSSLEKCLEKITPLKDEFERFCHLVGETSQMCRYWNCLQRNVQTLKDLIAADRNGDWEGHFFSVQKILPTFAE